MRAASPGAPAAGYCTSYNGRGKPPKSWIVRGRATAVTAVPGRYQCAETHSTARGRGRSFPRLAQPRVQLFSWMAFIGFPCPKKIAGILAARELSNTASFPGRFILPGARMHRITTKAPLATRRLQRHGSRQWSALQTRACGSSSARRLFGGREEKAAHDSAVDPVPATKKRQ